MSIMRRISLAPRKLIKTLEWQKRNDLAVLSWATEGVIAQNWGDKLNPYLAGKISCQEIIHRADVYPVGRKPVHYFIGSHLATACSDPRGVVWGSGFISANVPVSGCPRDIRAVRGWLSNERLKGLGLSAPDVVGDAALLLPRIYKPEGRYERRSLGVIPHCFEWDLPFYAKTREWSDARVINICGDIEDVIEQIISCDRIVSSSLHGIICADAYDVPSIWLHASDLPVGDGFKFRDYFSSVGRPDTEPFIPTKRTERQELEDLFFDYRIQIDLDELWEACPLLPSKAVSAL